MALEDIKKRLKDAENDYQLAQISIIKIKKLLIDSETKLIGAKINKEKATEELRIFYATTYIPEFDQRDKEIQDFREKYPELCKKKD